MAGCQIIESGLILAVTPARILFRSRQNPCVVCAALLSIFPQLALITGRSALPTINILLKLFRPSQTVQVKELCEAASAKRLTEKQVPALQSGWRWERGSQSPGSNGQSSLRAEQHENPGRIKEEVKGRDKQLGFRHFFLLASRVPPSLSLSLSPHQRSRQSAPSHGQHAHRCCHGERETVCV